MRGEGFRKAKKAEKELEGSRGKTKRLWYLRSQGKTGSEKKADQLYQELLRNPA